MKKFILGAVFLASSLYAGSDRFYDYAKVTYSEPVYEYVHDKPKRECREVRHKVRNIRHDDRYYSSNYNDSIGVDTLIGTAAGAVIGSQIGKGNGRVAAQIVGGLLGAKVANNMRNDNYNYDRRYNNRYDNAHDDYRYETRTECYDVGHRQKRKMITGYKNYFVYNGVKHYKITNRAKRKIKITHTIDF